MMNLFHGGRLAAMPPKLVNDEGDLFVYRPLIAMRGKGHREILRRHGIPDHSLHAVWVSGRVAAGRHERAARSMGDAFAGTARGNVPCAPEWRPSHLADERVGDFLGLGNNKS